MPVTAVGIPTPSDSTNPGALIAPSAPIATISSPTANARDRITRSTRITPNASERATPSYSNTPSASDPITKRSSTNLGASTASSVHITAVNSNTANASTHISKVDVHAANKSARVRSKTSGHTAATSTRITTSDINTPTVIDCATTSSSPDPSGRISPGHSHQQ